MEGNDLKFSLNVSTNQNMVSIGYNEIKRYKCISRKQDHLVVSSVTFQIYVLYHAVHYVTSILRGFQNDTHTNTKFYVTFRVHICHVMKVH